MANKVVNFPPVNIPAAATNLLNCNITSVAGPVGYTQTQPYLLVKHIRITNKDTVTRTVTLYKGATGGSAAGTEFAFAAQQIPAGQPIDWYGNQRFDAADFLTGISDLTAKCTIEIDAEIALS
jgi:hypothetical protein